MITYEQEHDFVYWGLILFNSDPYANCGYDGVVTQEDEEHYPVNYFADHYGAGECCNVENDEAIAHTVQLQELSQRAIIESSNKVSGYPQDCVDQSIGDFSSGQNCGQEVQDDTGPLSSCSSPEEKLVSEVDRLYSLELADEYALDREVGKRLNQMVPVPVTTLDHQRLLERLQVYNLVELKVEGDGICQFRALSDQFYRSPEHHEFLRQQVVNQVGLSAFLFFFKSYPDIYKGYVLMAYGDYLEKMSKSGEWGDHVTLQAAADLLFFLSFWAEVHYNSIYPFGDVPGFGITKKKKKKGGMFQNKHFESPDEYQ
ncbi:hypothetical protein ES319_D13G269900v1 [Gossypium barbadense]|uniref:OTU domain-containing protein n=1 Tax=Gossypium barbadense TaxID=3634 RepID=A0A5J5NRQ5_GOSBA|nr:hypothetical protein ES319_D13G269900v1 [Gossypium barbadense]